MPRRRDETLLRAIGQRFQVVRQERGWTQERLAEALELQPITLSRWERGERAVSLSVLARSADVLGVSLGDLVDVTRKAPRPPADAQMAELKRIWRRLDERGRDLAVRLVREVGR